MLDDFIQLSKGLTGVDGLDPGLANDYMVRFKANPDVGGTLQDLIDTYKRIVAAGGGKAQISAGIAGQIMGNDKLRPPAQQLIYLWYVSAFFALDPTDPTKSKGTWQYGPPQHYEQGLVWSIIRAHAPMTFGGKVGYWTEKP